MKYAFKFNNLCGTVYRCGNLTFTPDGNTLISPVGNRVTVFDLKGHSSFTLDVEARSDIARICVSPDGGLLVIIDVDGYALVVNLRSRVVLHRFKFKECPRDACFSPDGRYLAVTAGRKVEVWRTPGVDRVFSAFVLHRVYTGHYDDVTCVSWDPTSRYILTGSGDMTARVYTLDPVPGYIPVTLSAHRDAITAAKFAAHDVIVTVAADGGVCLWTCTISEAGAPVKAALAAGKAGGRGRLAAADGASSSSAAGGAAAAAGDASVSGVKRKRSSSVGAVARPYEDDHHDDDVAADADEEEAGAAAADDDDVDVAGAAGAASGGFDAGRVTSRDGSTAALIARVGGRHQSVKSATDVLASRRRHAFPLAPPAGGSSTGTGEAAVALQGEWTLTSRLHLKPADHARVQSVALHAGSSMLVVGFTTGIFGIYTLPDLTPVHSLSISQHTIHSAAVNATGEWIAFGSRTLGQLLVWEWRTETYVLKQQGHFYDMACVAYSPNGQLIATGGDDGKVKVWNATTGFCFCTFTEHTGPITALQFIGGKGGHGLAVLSASLDGTVRAFDLVRYRNFRTLVPPSPAQLTCLAADETGEVVCAGGLEPFSIYVWALQTGKLTDVLAGHAAPVSGLSFSPATALLASSSWDKTVRLWDVYRSGTATETFTHGSDVLAVAFRPDGGQLVSSTLDGQLHVWDTKRGAEVGTIDCRRDAAGGRKKDDIRTARTTAAGKCFSSLAYTSDGECVLAGGRTKYIALYAIAPALLLRKWQITHNRSLDGVLDKLNSKLVGEAGPLSSLDLADARADSADKRGAADDTLPGVVRGDAASKRRVSPEVRTKAVVIAPTGRSFAVASTEGLLVYGLDETLFFDPIDLGEGITIEAVKEALEAGSYGRALLMALHLNDALAIRAVVEACPVKAIPLLARVIPPVFLPRLLSIVASALLPGHAASSPHLDLHLCWCLVLLDTHSRVMTERGAAFAGVLRDLQKALLAHREALLKIVDENRFMLAYLSAPAPPSITSTGGGGGRGGASAGGAAGGAVAAGGAGTA